ncbi:MAG: radical SAM family heme chaperone HemW [Bacillota bacterium]|nr:radical SAM family heme chaperone HemW [Bacillota bacterium]
MGVSLYVHVPFCKSKCMYCDFCSYSGFEKRMMEYTHALCNEILLSCKNKSIDTIFIGGGTPTYLSLEAWSLLKDTFKVLNIEKNIEFTVECNPGTADEEKLRLLREMGVNRISIGLQAWQDRLLKKLGRIHSRDEFVRSFNIIRSCGFENINVDVMFGLPSQSIPDFRDTLENVVKLHPEHISCYSLIVEEGTPFGEMYDKGRLELPEEEEERGMYEYAVSFLKKKGYMQYEISNFSREGFECRHNITYWKLREYIGCGAAAHSYMGGSRYRNEEDIEEYIKAVNSRGDAVVEKRQNTMEDDMEEFMFMGLRMIEGVNKSEFYRRFGTSMAEVYEEVINKYTEFGFLVEKGDNISLTEAGIQVSNTVMSDFILDRD